MSLSRRSPYNWLTLLSNRVTIGRVRTAASPLLPIFRSRLQGELLALLFGAPGKEWTIEHLAARVARPYQTVANEVRRLQAGDLVRTRTVGRSKLVQANAASPYFGPLAQLVLMSFGPPLVVREEFARLPGVEQVFIFGSWAARYAGEAGPAPNDVDVLLVGTPDRDQAYEAAQRAQDRLGREVNVTLCARQQWEHGDDAFTRQLRSSALLHIPAAGTGLIRDEGKDDDE
jgi:predicted nucleotidyltransferase